MSLPRIFMIGPMGSGKTTVGRFLARRMGLVFHDLDQEIERRCGVDVRTIFDIEGEEGFRLREHALLNELTLADSLLLATGGGSVLRADNRALLRDRGLVVWLKTCVDQQIRRLEKDQRRPLLQAPDREERLRKLAEERDPLYAECAHLIVDSDNVPPLQMAQRAAKRIQQHLESEQVS